MKRYISRLVFGAVLLTSALSAHAQVSLKGQLKDLNTDTIIVSTTDAKLEKGTRDTLVIKNGKISLSYPTTNLLHVKIIEKPKIGRRTGDGFDFYLLPGKPMTINGSKFDYTIKGCDIYKKIEAYQKGVAPLEKQLYDVIEPYNKEIATAKTPEERLACYAKHGSSIKKALAEIRKHNLDFIKANPDNEASCIALCNIENFYEGFDVMTERIKASEWALAYKYPKQSADHKKQREEQEKVVAEGKMAPNFTLKDINGNDFTLSSLRGKYVVLDFWGSWCGWCIKALPKQKECYAKHKDSGKLEFISIDCRDTEAKWKAAVEKHNMTWIQVKNEDKDKIPDLYAVPGYPTFVIIDPEGKIIKRFVGEEPEMYTFIDSLFS